MTTVSSDIEQVIARLAPENRRQRQTTFLRPLNVSLIGASLLGLVALSLLNPNVLGYTIVVSGLLFSLLVLALERSGRVSLAAHLFSIGVNCGVLFIFAANLFQAGNLALGIVFACVLAMSIMLAGMLLGALYGFLFALVDALSVVVVLWRFFALAPASAEASALGSALLTAVPVITFLVVVAVITWLYQRSLDLSEAQLSMARQEVVRNELLRRDLAIARELQQRLYPPPPLTTPALRIASRSEPARETSGDFYDFIDLDEGRLGIVVADVTGKSIAAALLMALARGTLRAAARRYSGPAEALAHANEALCRDHTARQMITAFYGILDTASLTLRFSNAGHPYPVLRRGDRLSEIELGGLPLGARSDATYYEAEIQLQPGDQVYILSDGLVEERNGRELFGYDRLSAAILSADPCEAGRALDDLWRSVASFRGASEQDDDITLVVLQATHEVPVAAAETPLEAGAAGS